MSNRLRPAPIGRRFERLVVLDEIQPRTIGKLKKRFVRCYCDCGNVTDSRLEALYSGNTRSCGCLHREKFSSPQVIKSGDKFGRLTVVRQIESIRSVGGWSKRKWKLMCDCGNDHEATTGALTSGNTKSCGCLHAESSAENGKKSRIPLLNPLRGFATVKGIYISGAKKRGRDFELSDETLAEMFAANCHYCGTPPSNIVNVSNQTVGEKFYFYNGIDRKNNQLGYIDSNCVPCCSICNHAKHTMSYETFINWVSKVANHVSQDAQEEAKWLEELNREYARDRL